VWVWSGWLKRSKQSGIGSRCLSVYVVMSVGLVVKKVSGLEQAREWHFKGFQQFRQYVLTGNQW